MLLDGIAYDRHIQSIREASDALIDEGDRRYPDRAWSICELQLSDADIHWLHDWAKMLRADQIGLSLRQATRRPKIGLLLLAFVAENCRRDHRERGIYEVFAEADWDESVQHLLFSSSGYPRSVVRESLEDACRCYHLRHAFDAATTQPWYLTIKLQFGFTLPGAREQLEHWLVGTPPDAIEMLLDGNAASAATGTQVASDTFAELWDTFRRYRADHITASEARRAIAESPWTLAEWADDLLTAAARPVGSGSVYIVDAASLTGEATDANIDEEPEIVESPRAVWVENSIRIHAKLRESFLHSLRAACYFLSVDGEGCDVLRKQPDGTYRNLAGTAEIILPTDRERLMIAVADDSGHGLASQLIDLSSADEDFRAYNANGGVVNAQRLSPERGYTLRLPASARLTPDADFGRRFDSTNFRWVELLPGWSSSASIQVPGDLVEIPLSAGDAETESREDWTERLQVVERTSPRPAHFRLSIIVPDEVSVLGLRVSGTDVARESSNGAYQSRDIPLSALSHDGVATVRIVAKRRHCRVVHRTVKVERTGLLIFQRSIWKSLSPSDTINGMKLSRTQVVIRPGKTSRDEGWTLLEGTRRVDFRPDYPRRLANLGRRGWPLRATDHRYNRVGDVRLLELSQCVVDQGIVDTAMQRPGSRLVCFELLDPLEPATDHHCVVWTRSGRLANVASEDIQAEGQQWIVDPERAGIGYDDLVVAGAIGFRGTRLGSWWTEEWWQPIRNVRNADDAAAVAACLRWFGLPLMERKTDIQAVATAFGVPFFNEWVLPGERFQTLADAARHVYRLTDQLLPGDLLSQDDDETGWPSTVRSILAGWCPTADEALTIAPVPLEQQADRDGSVQGLVNLLATTMPVLASRLVTAWLSAHDSERDSLALRHLLSCEIREPLEARRGRFVKEHESLPAQVDDFHPELPWLPFSEPFVDSLVEAAHALADGKEVPPVAAENLETAHNSTELCRFICSRLLEPAATPCGDVGASQPRSQAR